MNDAAGMDQRRKKPAHPASTSAEQYLGSLIAWIAAVACGWQVYARADLLEAVLRGALVWLGVTVLWRVGLSLCQRIIYSSPPSTDTKGAPAESGESQDPKKQGPENNA